MRSILLRSVCTATVAGLLFFAINISHQFKEEQDFVILADKVGNPTLMTTFRVDPAGHENKDSNHCSVGGDKLYTPWNVSVFTAASVGDVLRRYHHTDFYRIFGKTILQDCYDAFLPVKIVSLFPDMNYWPFKKDSLTKNDPDYDRIFQLSKSQQ